MTARPYLFVSLGWVSVEGARHELREGMNAKEVLGVCADIRSAMRDAGYDGREIRDAVHGMLFGVGPGAPRADHRIP